ncbi:hypothetical protein WR25_15191 [Diploscapter pachys]|uniref:Uncharacterized protein n=1 Tax=Diploscapter pachys TaxID=2018661 RepID=A0A2A2K0J2_9BILA|nr:hypothetical protein WR25_15191 [Diploscapter pachys]
MAWKGKGRKAKKRKGIDWSSEEVEELDGCAGSTLLRLQMKTEDVLDSTCLLCFFCRLSAFCGRENGELQLCRGAKEQSKTHEKRE